MVFRKDYSEHKENPSELVDSGKRLVVGAGINTRDHEARVPALVAAGADVLCIDSSDGYSEWQSETIQWIRKKYGDSVKVGGGNVVDAEGFRYLVDAGADFVKVGIGGGSICITREQKGIGRGQATAVMEVAQARDAYFQEIALALAMGADFVMMGRFFARFDEAPGRRLRIGGNFVKEYWGEGSNRARNWQRYHEGGQSGLGFEEGVDGYVPYAGKLKDSLDVTLDKIRSTMVSCGAATIPELQAGARITLASAVSIREGSAHDIDLKENEMIFPTS
jgi:IMP dehydrogenase